MAHYDLYETIGLDRTHDSAALASELDQRINSGVATNPGGVEELRIAREILGDPQRRGLYDQKLSDPNAPEINIAALRDLAAANFGPAPAAPAAAAGSTQVRFDQHGQQVAGEQPQQGEQGEQGPSAFARGRENFSNYSKQAQERLNPAMEKTKSEIARSSKGVIAGTAIATALIMLLLWGLIAGLGGDHNEGKAKKAANQFLELRTNDETERWLIDNAAGDSRSDLNKYLKIGDGFSGVDNYYSASDPKAGKVFNFKDFVQMNTKFTEDDYYNSLHKEGIDELYVVEVLNGNSTPAGGNVVVSIQDGKAKIADVNHNLDTVPDSVESWL